MIAQEMKVPYLHYSMPLLNLNVKNGSTWMNEKKQLHLLLAFTGKVWHWIYSSKSYPYKISFKHSHFMSLELKKVWKASNSFSMLGIYDKHYLRTMLYHPEMTIYLDYITCLVIFLLRILYFWLTNRINSQSWKGMKVIDIKNISFHLNKVGYYV